MNTVILYCRGEFRFISPQSISNHEFLSIAELPGKYYTLPGLYFTFIRTCLAFVIVFIGSILYGFHWLERPTTLNRKSSLNRYND